MNRSHSTDKMKKHEQSCVERSFVGPFTVRRSSTIGYEIVGGDGTVAVWVVGENNAMWIERLLNAAYQDDAVN